MAIAQSKLTAKGQISVPAEVRKKLGVGPGSVLEWEERDEEIIVRRAGKNTSEQVHAVLFKDGQPRSSASVKDGVRAYMRKKHARG